MTRDDRIRIRAYEIWQREGRPEGRHEQHWVEATREIDEEEAAARLREADRRQGDENVRGGKVPPRTVQEAICRRLMTPRVTRMPPEIH